ncbi:LCP family protein [Anaerofustis sp.]|uniref:LCP family protein n=1 Tax=Anaerofustis sp. TaxID=1872517 RepID=UPI0025BC40E6|nr:LCP family protein [Anaerofustis sp.]
MKQNKVIKPKKSLKRNKNRKSKKGSNRKKNIVTVLLAVLIIFASSGLGLAKSLGYNVLNNDPFQSEKYTRFSTKTKLSNSATLQDTMNILVFGIDKNEKRSETATIFRPDTIMLASINTKEKTIKLVSIPRDSRVDIYNTGGRDKVNSCFYYANQGLNETDKKNPDKVFSEGIKYLKNTVSDVLGGIQIDYYLGIDMDALPKIADVMGGVTIDVHQNLYAKNGHDRSTIKIKEGRQVLNGDQLLYYSRYRAYVDGDIGRVQIQQKIMKAIFSEFKKQGSFSQIPQIYNLVQDMVETDLKFAQIASLGLSFKDFNIDNLQSYTLPGNFGNLSGVSYWIVNQSERVTFVKDLFNIDTQQLSQDPRSD